MRRFKAVVLALSIAAGALAAAPAAAQSRTRSGGSTILGAETVAPGGDIISTRFGWPDVTMEYTHGVRPGFDVGGRLQFIYGVENTTTSKFGIGMAVPMRWTLSRSGNVKLSFHVDPGLRIYTYDPALFGFQFPFGLNLELPAAAPIHFGVGADFNATLFVTGAGSPYFFFGPLIGPWMEYRVDQRFSFGIDSRFGAIINAYSSNDRFAGGTETDFGFRMQVLLAYRM